MTSPRDKIARLVASGRISTEEGGKLLDALDDAPAPGWRALVDPFDALTTRAGLGLVAAGALAQVAASRLGVRYDGALDVHLAPAPPLAVSLVELGLGLGAAAVVVWLVARAVSRPRPVDVLVAVGIGRLPLIALGLVLALIFPAPVALEAIAGWRLAAAGVVALPTIAWAFALWFFGYRTATGLRGARLWVTFLAGLLAAEIATKLALAALV